MIKGMYRIGIGSVVRQEALARISQSMGSLTNLVARELECYITRRYAPDDFDILVEIRPALNGVWRNEDELLSD